MTSKTMAFLALGGFALAGVGVLALANVNHGKTVDQEADNLFRPRALQRAIYLVDDVRCTTSARSHAVSTVSCGSRIRPTMRRTSRSVLCVQSVGSWLRCRTKGGPWAADARCCASTTRRGTTTPRFCRSHAPLTGWIVRSPWFLHSIHNDSAAATRLAKTMNCQ